jgi:hypothetical protein
MKKSVFFIVGLIGLLLITVIAVTKTSEAKAISAEMVELTFEDGTTAMGVPLTPYLDAKDRTCFTNKITGKNINWRETRKLYKEQKIAYDCYCTSCGIGFSTQQSGVCCVTCPGCGMKLDKFWCQVSACNGCCCGVFFIP